MVTAFITQPTKEKESKEDYKSKQRTGNDNRQLKRTLNTFRKQAFVIN